MRDAVLAGELALPVGDVPEPFVDADDIADVAVAALTEDRHIGELYELTGPRLLTFADAVGEIGAATRARRSAFAPVSEQELRGGARRPRRAARTSISLLRYLFAVVLDGRNASLADGVQRALGRPPRDFRRRVGRGAGAAAAADGRLRAAAA